jgi:hypothetical protein
MKNLFLLISILAICSCRHQSKSDENLADSPLKLALPMQHFKEKKEIIPIDSQLVYENISSTEVVEKSLWGLSYLYVDSTMKKAYPELDNNIKIKLLPQILKMDTTWIRMDIKAFLISRQEKIGELQPIIIQVSGTDFGALLLIILDEHGEEVSGMFLNGGEDSGPLKDMDTVLLLQPYKRSFFNGNQIKTYSISALVKTYNTNKPDIIDSVSYVSKIELNGTINTRKIDSVRIERKYKWR